MSGTITLLTSFGPLLTKKHTKHDDGSITTEEYANAATYSAQVKPFRDIDDLFEILREAARNPRTCAIPGLPAAHANHKRMNRRKTSRKGQAAPDVTDNPEGVAWAKLDLDSLPAPRSAGYSYGDDDQPNGVIDPDLVVMDTITNHLPSYLHGTAVVYQFTSSAGVKPWSEVRLGLWYVLETPLRHEQLRAWAKSLPPAPGSKHLVDPAVFSSNQCNFIAPPVFVGMPDPCGDWRLGLLPGGWA